MFGVVCSGRPIQIASQVEQTKFAVSVPNASNISHFAIFLLPESGFSDVNFTGLVYLQLPNSNEYKLLGGINPLKPSAIYKINNNSKPHSNSSSMIDDIDMSDPVSDPSAVLNIGISIEPTANAELILQEEKNKQALLSGNTVGKTIQPAAPKTKTEVVNLANSIVTNAYNYLGSFMDSTGKVPMKAFDGWWDKFKTKLQNNPDFLESIQN